MFYAARVTEEKEKNLKNGILYIGYLFKKINQDAILCLSFLDFSSID